MSEDIETMKRQMKAMRREIDRWREVSDRYRLCQMLDSIDDGQWYGTQLATLRQMTNETGAMGDRK